MGKILVSISENTGINQVSKKELSKLYLKKTDKINDTKVIILDTKEDHDEFCRKILNKTPSQIHAYWMKQVFLGRKTPPPKYVREKISQIIKDSENTIGYSSGKIEGRIIYETK